LNYQREPQLKATLSLSINTSLRVGGDERLNHIYARFLLTFNQITSDQYFLAVTATTVLERKYMPCVSHM